MGTLALLIVSFALYLANSILEVYIQYLYFAGSLESLMAGAPAWLSESVVSLASLGYYGIMGYISMLVLVVMGYASIDYLEGRGYARYMLMITALIQLVLGNSGYVVGFVALLIAIARGRSSTTAS